MKAKPFLRLHTNAEHQKTRLPRTAPPRRCVVDCGQHDRPRSLFLAARSAPVHVCTRTPVTCFLSPCPLLCSIARSASYVVCNPLPRCVVAPVKCATRSPFLPNAVKRNAYRPAGRHRVRSPCRIPGSRGPRAPFFPRGDYLSGDVAVKVSPSAQSPEEARGRWPPPRPRGTVAPGSSSPPRSA